MAVLGALALLNVLGASPAEAGAPVAKLSPMPPVELERFVDGVVLGAMSEDHIAGVSVAVVQDGRVVLLKGYGQAAPGRGVDPRRDLFRIASVSKTFTWIALMQAVERGRVKLEAPVNDYLPPVLKILDQGFSAPIRVIDLMSHAAGFEDSVLGHLLVDRPERITPLSAYLADHRPRRVRPPGQVSTYSNYGAALAGYIAARTAGVDYPTLVERDLFGPLGMTGASFREPYPPRAGLPAPLSPDLTRRLATGYAWRDGGFQPQGFEYLTQDAPIGAASATAADMARYMLMQLGDGVLDGRRIYGAQTAEAFRTPILHTPPGVNGWAHGLRIGVLPGGYPSYSHSGALQRFFSSLTLAPALRMGIFVNTNTSTGHDLTERLPVLLVQHFYAPATPSRRRPGDPRLAAHKGDYAGRYATTRRSYGGLEQFMDLLAGDDSVTVTPNGYLVTQLGREKEAWVPEGAPGRFIAADGDQPLVFDLDPHGRATGFPTARGGAREVRCGWLLDNAVFRPSALAAAVAGLASWMAVLLRPRREPAGPPWQARAHRLGLLTSALWLAALVAFWRSGLLVGSAADLMAPFPGPGLRAASWAALLASVGSAGLVGATLLAAAARAPAEEGWSRVRKTAALLTAATFLFLALQVGARGGLTPWR